MLPEIMNASSPNSLSGGVSTSPVVAQMPPSAEATRSGARWSRQGPSRPNDVDRTTTIPGRAASSSSASMPARARAPLSRTTSAARASSRSRVRPAGASRSSVSERRLEAK